MKMYPLFVAPPAPLRIMPEVKELPAVAVTAVPLVFTVAWRLLWSIVRFSIPSWEICEDGHQAPGTCPVRILLK